MRGSNDSAAHGRGWHAAIAAVQRGDAAGAALASTSTQLDLNVTSGDAGPCVGDCDRSGNVSVNERRSQRHRD